VVWWPFSSKDVNLTPKEKAMEEFWNKLKEPLLSYVGKYPCTIYSVGFEPRYYCNGLGFLIDTSRQIDSTISILSDDSKFSGFRRDCSEDTISLFVDDLYDDSVYNKLKEHLEGLNYRIIGASYLTVFPEPVMRGFGPICLSKEEKDMEKYLENAYGELKCPPTIVPSLPVKYATLYNIGKLIISYANQYGWSKELADLYDEKFAKPAYKINTDSKDPAYTNPERLSFGMLTTAMWGEVPDTWQAHIIKKSKNGPPEPDLFSKHN